jgi:ERO1-like protein beta
MLSGGSPAPVSLPDSMSRALREGDEGPAECLEKRVYYKIISGSLTYTLSSCLQTLIDYIDTGLHASISTHICAETINKQTGEWVSTITLKCDP